SRKRKAKGQEESDGTLSSSHFTTAFPSNLAMLTRLDVLIIVFWQILLIFNVQLLMPIFLNYMPDQKCKGSNPQDSLCYNVHGKCNKCVDQCLPSQSLCLNNASCFFSISSHNSFFSAANEYGYFCNPNLRFIRIDTIQYLGALLGTIVFGLMADEYGRRRILLIALSLGLPALLLSGEVKHVLWFYAFRFVVGLCNGGGLIVGWTFVTELVTPKKRVLLSVFSSWPFARLIITIVSYLTGEWRMTTRILALSSFPLIPVLFLLLPESPVWLATKCRRTEYDESISKLNTLAGITYIKKNKEHFKCLRLGVREGMRQIFVHPLLRKRMLVLFSFWFVTFYSYYILDLNSETMYSHDLFVGQFGVCSLLVGVKLMLGLLDQYTTGMKRRRMDLVAQTSFFISVSIILILYFYGHKGSTSFMLSFFAATISIELCSDICYLTVNELMPSEVRGSALGATSMMGRIATVASTFAIALKDIFEPGLYIFIIVISIINWFVSFFFLETKGVELKEVTRRKPSNAIPSIKVDFHGFEDEPQTPTTGVIVFEEEEEEVERQKTTETNQLDNVDFIEWATVVSNLGYDQNRIENEEKAVDEETRNEVDYADTLTCNLVGGTCSTVVPVESKAFDETRANIGVASLESTRDFNETGDESAGEECSPDNIHVPYNVIETEEESINEDQPKIIRL
ncbi:hypothetical protein PFISCL1PPCAC_24896, partial [Pristionchus fissidentatus]